MTVWNVCSLNNKIDEIMTVLESDVIFISETWMKSQNNKTTATIKDYGYIMTHVIRDDPSKERGGGVGIIHKKDIGGKSVKPKKMFSSFQYTSVQIPLPKQNNKLILICVYRLLYVPVSDFLKEGLLSENWFILT